MLLNVCIQRAPNYAMQIHVPLRPKATFSQFNYLKSTLKRVAINFKLPNKAVLKTTADPDKVEHYLPLQ